MKAKLNIAAGALALCAALAASAAALPQAKTENGVTYIDGGVGHDEAAAMKAEAKDYPLSMVFSAGKDNEYLAGVKVAIRNKAGKEVLKIASGGPIMLVKLPAGRYTVAAERDGKLLQRTVHVSGKSRREIDFHWPGA